MIDREIAVLLSYPMEVLGATRLGGAVDPVAFRPGTPPADQPSRSPAAVPVYSEVRPVHASDAPPERWRCIVVVTRPGPPGERLFGHRGVGRRLHLIDVLSYGENPEEGAVGRAFTDARTLAHEANHIVACGMSAKVLTDWPAAGWNRATDPIEAAGTLGAWGEVEVLPVHLMTLDGRGRPVYGFTARIVQWA